MNNFMKTIINAVKSWTKSEIKESAADWNEDDSNSNSYVKNRTHYDTRRTETFRYSFDGNFDGKEVISNSETEFLIKISDDYASVDKWVGAVCSVYEEGEVFSDIVITEDLVQDMGNGNFSIDLIAWIAHDLDLGDGAVLSPGIWIACNTDETGTPVFYVKSIERYEDLGELKKLNEKYLPDNLQDWSEVQVEEMATTESVDKRAKVVYVNDADSGMISSHTFQEIKGWLDAGLCVVVNYKNHIYSIYEFRSDPESAVFLYHDLYYNYRVLIDKYGGVQYFVYRNDETVNHSQLKIDACVLDVRDGNELIFTNNTIQGSETYTLATEEYVDNAIDEAIESGDFGGDGGIYVGDGEAPEGTKVQIDTSDNGSEFTIPDVLQTTGDSEVDTMSQKAITEALAMSGGGIESTFGNKTLLMDETIDIPADVPVTSISLTMPDNVGDFDFFDIYVTKQKPTNEFTSAGVMNFKLMGQFLVYYGFSKMTASYENILMRVSFPRNTVEFAVSSVGLSTNVFQPRQAWNWIQEPSEAQRKDTEFRFQFGTEYSGSITVKIWGYK